MKPWAYYNEIDKGKAFILREAMDAGQITEGEIDTRSIADVRGDDVRGFARCHFFAGVGLWDAALTRAGWPDDRVVWTASCPCQPFSNAGKRKGKADERHLYPELARLIGAGRPAALYGEQVSSKDGLAWLDDVFDHLEGEAYTVRALDSCAAGAGGPHIRQRLYWAAWLADDPHIRLKRSGNAWRGRHGSSDSGKTGRLADDRGARLEERRGIAGDAGRQRAAIDGDSGALRLGDGQGERWGRRADDDDRGRRECPPVDPGAVNGLGDGNGERRDGEPVRLLEGRSQQAGPEATGRGPVNGAWAGADWVLTRPQRVGDRPSLRPVKRGIFPVAHGRAGRVLALRAAGDAIVLPQAQAWVETVMEEIGVTR